MLPFLSLSTADSFIGYSVVTHPNFPEGSVFTLSFAFFLYHRRPRLHRHDSRQLIPHSGLTQRLAYMRVNDGTHMADMEQIQCEWCVR
jgi:hypothetical protein